MPSTVLTIAVTTHETIVTSGEVAILPATVLTLTNNAPQSVTTEKNIAIIDDTLCRGCGTCVAACPSGATKARNFTLEQISAEIREVAK